MRTAEGYAIGIDVCRHERAPAEVAIKMLVNQLGKADLLIRTLPGGGGGGAARAPHPPSPLPDDDDDDDELGSCLPFTFDQLRIE